MKKLKGSTIDVASIENEAIETIPPPQSQQASAIMKSESSQKSPQEALESQVLPSESNTVKSLWQEPLFKVIIVLERGSSFWFCTTSSFEIAQSVSVLWKYDSISVVSVTPNS